MNRARRIGWVLATAVAAVSVSGLSSPAAAQQRVGTDGRALDANNRVGSGGYNEAGSRGPAHVAGNQIVTGNVTGGLQFRGRVDYTDPFAFRGVTAGVTSDRFIRDSAGVPIPGVTRNNNAQVIRPFYGESQTVERPPGYTLEAPGTGYVPAPRISREPGDLRLGRPLDTPLVSLPGPGQLILPGPVDPNTNQPGVITASPLYGVRMWNFDEQADQQFLVGLNDRGVQRSRLDEQTLQQMRQELLESQSDQEPQDAADDELKEGQRTRNRLDLRLDTPFESPRNNPLGSSGQFDDQASNEPLGADVKTGQKSGSRLMTAPERQSAQYAELRRRLQRFNRLPESMADLEANRQYNEMIRARQQKEEEAKDAEDKQKQQVATPGASGTGTATQAQQAPGAAGTQSDVDPLGLRDFEKRRQEILEGKASQDSMRAQIPGAVREQETTARENPLVIGSLATGVQAKGLADFLREAEDMMRQGKFYAALDQYDLAEQVAPNNPMVPLGRAIAELGAGYYGRAEQHLRDAFTKDPALLMGRYDLRSFLGEEKLEFLNTDLKSIANRETKEPRPVFLLAFLEYSVGSEKKAAAYLDLAEKRSGGQDPFYGVLRKYWSLPATGAGVEDANK